MAQLWTLKSRTIAADKSANRISYISYIAWKGTEKEAEQNRESGKNTEVERITGNMAKTTYSSPK